jgi:hypothetical protein
MSATSRGTRWAHLLSAALLVPPALIAGAGDEPAGRLRGVVVDSRTGKPVGNVSVALHFDPSHQIGRSVTGDAGEFTFGPLPPGPYSLTLVPPVSSDLAIEAQHAVDVVADRITIDRVRLEVGGRILLHFKKRDGTPWDPALAGRRAFDCRVLDLPMEAEMNNILWDHRPNAVISSALKPAAGLGLEVTLDGFAPIAVEGVAVRVGQETVVDVVADPDDPTGIDGNGAVPDETLDVYRLPERKYVGGTRADAGGRFEMLGLPPGRYRIVAQAGTLEVAVVGGQRAHVSFVTSPAQPKSQDSGSSSGRTRRDLKFTPCSARGSEYYELTEEGRKTIRSTLDNIAIKLTSGQLACCPGDCREKMMDSLSKLGGTGFEDMLRGRLEIIYGCPTAGEDCGGNPGTDVLKLWSYYPGEQYADQAGRVFTYTKRCGCFESVLFHELLHNSGQGLECPTWACSKKCYSCALDLQEEIKKKTAMGLVLIEKCRCLTPYCIPCNQKEGDGCGG